MSEQDFAYKVNANKQIEITRYMGEDERVVIPETIEGYPVAVLKRYSFASSDIVEITIPENVETIEQEAFAICESLEKVILPSTLKSIGAGAFKSCDNLKEISFPNGNEVFSVKDGILYDEKTKTLILCPPGTGKKTVVIDEETLSIGPAAFYMNRDLEMVQLPLGLKRIGPEAFLFTDSLKIIRLTLEIEEISFDSFLLIKGARAEKPFVIYAFPDTYGYRYAQQQQIHVEPLYALLYD